jgi:hypothetical protein
MTMTMKPTTTMTMTRTTRLSKCISTRRLAALALAAGLAAASACSDHDPPAATRKAADSKSPRAAAKHASLDPRDQYELARALDQVEKGRDPEGAVAGYDQIRASWTGKRYRWTVRVVAPLCRSKDECNVLPFDRGGSDKAIVHGWMPHLVLDDGGFAAIQRACAGQQSCRLEMEATLSKMVLDTENPTSLEFDDVQIL